MQRPGKQEANYGTRKPQYPLIQGCSACGTAYEALRVFAIPTFLALPRLTLPRDLVGTVMPSCSAWAYGDE